MGGLLTIIGAFFASVALGAVGGLLGVTGCFLGAWNPGFAAAILGIVSIFAGRSAMVGSYDATLDGIKESIQDSFSSRPGWGGTSESSPDDCTGPLAVRLFEE